ncbi:RraA family protein [Candidatus Latescibacterota bacterium]
MKMKIAGLLLYCGIVLLNLISCVSSEAQVGVFSKSEILEYTTLYSGERFSDGRPKVSDEILDRLENIAIEEAWSVLKNNGYNNQFEGDFTNTNENPKLVGRAVTTYYLPLRPDVNDINNTKGDLYGNSGGRPKHWLMNSLNKGDVLVADVYGKKIEVAFVGSRLANSVYEKTGKGIVVDGGCRDLDGIREIANFPVFCRGWSPTSSKDIMLMGINTPIRIGNAVVMPGDVVMGRSEGVIFIPAHLALEVVETAEIIGYRDEFSFIRLREETYTPGQIDDKWSAEIEKDFREWLLKEKGKTLTPKHEEYLLKGQTW